MAKSLKSIVIIALLIPAFTWCQTELNVMFYNLLNYPEEDAIPNRNGYLDLILQDYGPDLFLVCELTDKSGADSVLEIIKSAVSDQFSMANYVPNTSDDTSGNDNLLQNQLYYNTSKFTLLGQTEVPTSIRDFNIYELRLNTEDQDTNPVDLVVVVCHLKASSGSTNAQIRFEMVQELDNYLSTLPSDTNVLLGGDLNVYTASESAFQELLDGSNNIVFADPPNRVGSWNNNPNFIDVFTQSTRTQSGLGGASGGFDDRFDFILLSDNMLGLSNINYKSESYRVYGNNGVSSCYNRRIDSDDCAGDLFSLELRKALHDFSDHLPVTLSLESSSNLLSVNDLGGIPDLRLIKTLVNTELVIHSSQALPLDSKFTVVNSLGQEVLSPFYLNNGTTLINTQNLSNGVYFLISQSNNAIFKKFVVGR